MQFFTAIWQNLQFLYRGLSFPWVRLFSNDYDEKKDEKPIRIDD